MTYFSSLLFHLFQSFSDFLLQLNWKWANIFNEISKYHSLNNCKYGFVKLLHSLLFNTSSELFIRVVLPWEGYVRKVSPVNFLQLFNFRFPFFLFFSTDGEGLGKLVSASHLHLRIIIVVLFLFYVSTKQQVLRESVFKYFCKKKKKNPSVGNNTSLTYLKPAFSFPSLTPADQLSQVFFSRTASKFYNIAGAQCLFLFW